MYNPEQGPKELDGDPVENQAEISETIEEVEEQEGGSQEVINEVREWKKLPRGERKAEQTRILSELFESEKQATSEIIAEAHTMLGQGIPDTDIREFLRKKTIEKATEVADIRSSAEEIDMSNDEKDFIWSIAKIKTQEGRDALRQEQSSWSPRP